MEKYKWSFFKPKAEYWLQNKKGCAATIKIMANSYKLEIYQKGGSSIFYLKDRKSAMAIGRMLVNNRVFPAKNNVC